VLDGLARDHVEELSDVRKQAIEVPHPVVEETGVEPTAPVETPGQYAPVEPPPRRRPRAAVPVGRVPRPVAARSMPEVRCAPRLLVKRRKRKETISPQTSGGGKVGLGVLCVVIGVAAVAALVWMLL